MSKEPNFDQPSMDDKIVHKIHEVAGQYTLKILHWIAAGFIGATITIGGAAVWATKAYVKLDDVVSAIDRRDRETAERVAAWTLWRVDVDAKLRTAESGATDRWRKSHQREWAGELRHKNPTLNVPDIDAIANRQTP